MQAKTKAKNKHSTSARLLAINFSRHTGYVQHADLHWILEIFFSRHTGNVQHADLIDDLLHHNWIVNLNVGPGNQQRDISWSVVRDLAEVTSVVSNRRPSPSCPPYLPRWCRLVDNLINVMLPLCCCMFAPSTAATKYVELCFIVRYLIVLLW